MPAPEQQPSVKLPTQILWPLLAALAGGSGVAATSSLRTEAASAQQVNSLERLHDQRITALEYQVTQTNVKLDRLNDKLDTLLIKVQKHE